MPSRVSTLVVAFCVAGFVGLASAAPLDTDPLAYDDGNGPDGGKWRGATVMNSDGLQSTVEYCVYAPGTFPYAGLSGWTPTPGEMVYAYQVYSSGTLAAMVFQVALLNPAGNIGAADLGNGGQAPSSMVLDGAMADWGFSPDGLLGEHSTGLVFSSIKTPQMWLGSVIDGESSMGLVPSPGPNDIPEPATISLLALGAVGLLRRKR